MADKSTTDASMTDEGTDAARAAAVRALEAEFSELITAFRRRMLENAQALAPGLLPAAYKVFTTIVQHAPVTASLLAESLAADKGQISRTVRELEQLGLVERARDPEDGRSSLISPTAEGLTRLEAVRAPHENALVHTLREWPVRDIRNLTRLLHALSEGAVPDQE